MSDSEFDGRPFVAGAMVGLRSFRVDGLGRLTAVTNGSIFRPGENVAQCRRDEVTVTVGGGGIGMLGGIPSPAKHRVAKLGCGCGFYACYRDESNPYRDRPDTLDAVVEGYCTVTTGSRGFRAEKARLVALVTPLKPKPEGRPFDGWARRYARTGFLGALFGIGLAAFGLVFGTALVVQFGAVLVPALLAVPLGAALGYLSWRGDELDSVPYASPVAEVEERFQLVTRNYPDVPVYASRAEALRAHPLTVPDPLTPETDPEFWTRAS